MSAGKGDTPRPVKWAVYTENYDAIFRKKPLKGSKAQKPQIRSKTK